MIKELKKTYELVPEITGEKGRWLEINEVAGTWQLYVLLQLSHWLRW